ncbi:hypothetical protein [Phaeocystidibacter marisrubri]|uniref:Bacterial surface antigen (D15) domain-containing protein n=1 Tax=Phaeocystidibacter marisrubri TaxID=1577780 RepID=A0A6L3ZCG7_9FLAO|nr:hypothetical protein [Phaeocystidibacter marisrubri]KAB2815553.1 hypothetical protein F8C82_07565 [Phaeocystidibacter marisrubri]
MRCKTFTLFVFVLLCSTQLWSQAKIDFDFSDSRQIDSSGYEAPFVVHGMGAERYNDVLQLYSSEYQFPKYNHFFLVSLSAPCDLFPQVSLSYHGTYKEKMIYFAELAPMRLIENGLYFYPDLELNFGYNLRFWESVKHRRLGKFSWEERKSAVLRPNVITKYSVGPRIGFRLDSYNGAPPYNSRLYNRIKALNADFLGVHSYNMTIGLQITSTYGANGFIQKKRVSMSRSKQHRYFIDMEVPLYARYIIQNPDVVPESINTKVSLSHRRLVGVRIGWEEIISSEYRKINGEYKSYGYLYRFGVGLHVSPRTSNESNIGETGDETTSILYLKLGIGFKPK